jgi:pimeloyl-ACP methyl ester carboxylesterase
MNMSRRPAAAGARPGWVRNDLFPFRSRFTEVGGHVIHYVDEGSGPVLLLWHGNPTRSFVYRDAITWLRDRFRCIAPDLPGSGLSTAAAGYADFAFREQERRRWESLLPHHVTRVLAGAGHFLPSDAPEDYAAAITSWWPSSTAAPAEPPQAQDQPG